MKAIFISFNQAYYEMILSIMDRNNIRGFTYWEEVQGRGSKNGEPHYCTSSPVQPRLAYPQFCHTGNGPGRKGRPFP